MDRAPLRDDAIAAARVFNRFFSESVGALSDAHLGTGLPLGHARVLFEIGRLAPIEMQALRSYLGLDAGYLSRTLSSLEKGGLIRLTASKIDGRARVVALTPKGKKRIETLDDRSDDKVAGWFERLDAEQTGRLLDAMSTIRRLLSFDIEIAPCPADSAEARVCLAAFFAELGRRFPGGFDPARSVPADAHEMSPPSGRFLLVSSRGLPRGCGAVKTLSPGIGEIKRMWIHPELRGAGVGRRLLEALEASSSELGHHTVRLDTSERLGEARALYRAAGYREIPAYNDNPYAQHWFEKRLEPKRAQRR
jgi:DNA-binding MarR family transcriptional regulator/GNAT superfamily N-acetyltransferase